MSFSVLSTSDARYMSFLNPTTMSSAMAFSFVKIFVVGSPAPGAGSCPSIGVGCNSCTALGREPAAQKPADRPALLLGGNERAPVGWQTPTDSQACHFG